MINNKIEWIVGDKYPIMDSCGMVGFEGELVGFIVNQIPVNWKDQSSYSNKSDSSTHLVFKFQDVFEKDIRFCIGKLNLREYFPNWGGGEVNVGYSGLELIAYEYGDSPEQLIKKLRQNWVFTKELCYDAIYKEGYVSK